MVGFGGISCFYSPHDSPFSEMANSEEVKVGQVVITIHQRATGAWFFKRKIGGRWKPFESVNKQKVVAEAKATAKIISEQKSNLLSLNPKDVQEFLAWKKERSKSIPLKDALEDYLAAKKIKGLSERYSRSLESLRKILEPLRDRNIREITPSEIDEIVLGVGGKERRKNNVRDDIATFFRWCRKKEILPDGITSAERAEEFINPHPKKLFFSKEELEVIIEKCAPEWLPWLLIGAFAGIRSEEIQRLEWSDVRLDRGMIDVRSETAKTRQRRLVPIQPNLQAWLEPYRGFEGTVCPDRIDNYIRFLTAPEEGYSWRQRSKRAIQWKANGLRHSYGSYRLAIIQNAPQVAEEMGNSVPMIKKHYAETVYPAEGAGWFSIMPSSDHARNVSRLRNVA